MAWVTPRTWVAGELATAANFNVHLRDNLLALRAEPSKRCDAYDASTQVVTSGNTDDLALDSEDADSATMHDTSTNNERVTIPSGGDGWYLCIGSSLTAGGSNIKAVLHLQKNGTTQVQSRNSDNMGTNTLTVAQLISCVATDYISLAGQAIDGTVTWGSATAAEATRLIAIGPWPAA